MTAGVWAVPFWKAAPPPCRENDVLAGLWRTQGGGVQPGTEAGVGPEANPVGHPRAQPPGPWNPETDALC